MSRTISKRKATLSIVLLMTTLILAVLSQAIMTAIAQDQNPDQAVIIIDPSLGGTTDPVPGTYTIDNTTNLVVTATADPGYDFAYWVISGNFTPGHATQTPTYILDENGTIIASFPSTGSAALDSLTTTANPLNITHGFGYTYEYQAIFRVPPPPVNTSPSPAPTSNTNLTAVVIIEPSSGGTTTPSQGTYEYANGAQFSLMATPDSTHVFKYWVISGDYTPGHQTANASIIVDENGAAITFPRPDYNGTDSLVATTNPLNVSHGYGFTFAYQAVFGLAPIATPTPTATPVQTATPTETPTATPSASPETGGLSTEWIIAIVVIVIIIIAVLAAVLMRRKK